MRIVDAFDPATLPAAGTAAPTIGQGLHKNSGLQNQCGSLYFMNKSNTGINLVFEDGSFTVLPAWQARVYTLPNKSNQVWMSQAYQLNTSGNPISMLYWEAYQQGENTNGLYTGPLPYQTNVGSPIVTAQELLASFANSMSLNVSLAGNSASLALIANFPDIAQVSQVNPGFLLLGSLQSGGAREMVVPYRSGYHEAIAQQFNVTVPNGGNTQTFQLANSNALTAIGFAGPSIFSANFQVGTISIDRNDGNFQSVVNTGISSANGTQIYSLTPQFGPYGYEGYNPQGGGLRAQLTFVNTTGAPQTVTIILLGSRFAFDDIICAITYTDWVGNAFGLGVHRLSQVLTLPLNLLVPTPITDPAQTAFGSLSYQVINTTEYYATKYLGNIYSIDCTIPAGLILTSA